MSHSAWIELPDDALTDDDAGAAEHPPVKGQVWITLTPSDDEEGGP